jgi:hypothetical protein
MSQRDKKEEQYVRERKAEAESISSTLNSPGWNKYIFPRICEVYDESEHFAFDETEEGRNARAICKALREVFSKIGVRVDQGNKAKEKLTKLLNR